MKGFNLILVYFLCTQKNNTFYVYRIRDTCINIFEIFEFNWNSLKFSYAASNSMKSIQTMDSLESMDFAESLESMDFADTHSSRRSGRETDPRAPARALPQASRQSSPSCDSNHTPPQEPGEPGPAAPRPVQGLRTVRGYVPYR